MGPGQLPANTRKLAITDHPGLVEAIEVYLAGLQVDEAVLVLGDEVAFTNSPWRFSIGDVPQRLGLRRLVVINDLVAQALSFATLRADEIGAVKSGTRDPLQPSLVIGPGTGLGVARLLPNGGMPVGVARATSSSNRIQALS